MNTRRVWTSSSSLANIIWRIAIPPPSWSKRSRTCSNFSLPTPRSLLLRSRTCSFDLLIVLEQRSAIMNEANAVYWISIRTSVRDFQDLFHRFKDTSSAISLYQISILCRFYVNESENKLDGERTNHFSMVMSWMLLKRKTRARWEILV